MISNRLKNLQFLISRKIVPLISIVFFINCACNLMGNVKGPDVFPTEKDQISAGPTLKVINPTVIATEPKPPDSNDNSSDTTSTSQSPLNETVQPVVGEITVVGGWYGPACDEEEGTFIYRWSVDLMKDPSNGRFIGVAKFHNCPGGGRVSYYLIGEPQESNIIFLAGEKTTSGGGDLFQSSDQTINFTFDLSKGIISPNLTP